MTTSPLPPIRKTCCLSDCCWSDNTSEPCYGEITTIDEAPMDDGYGWIHACEGHRNDGMYKPYQPPKNKDAL